MGSPAENWPTPQPIKKYDDGAGLEFEIIPEKEVTATPETPAIKPTASAVEHRNILVTEAKPLAGAFTEIKLPNQAEIGLDINRLARAVEIYRDSVAEMRKMTPERMATTKLAAISILRDIIDNIPTKNIPNPDYARHKEALERIEREIQTLR